MISLLITVPQPPRAGLGREREAAAPSAGHAGGDADRERIDPQRRQAHARLPAQRRVGRRRRPTTPLDAARSRRSTARSARPRRSPVRRRPSRTMVRTCSIGPLAHGTGDHPGLAEAAPAGAAAEHLDREAVVDDLGQRCQRALRVRPLAQVGDRALVDHGGDVVVAGRDAAAAAGRRSAPRTSTARRRRGHGREL